MELARPRTKDARIGLRQFIVQPCQQRDELPVVGAEYVTEVCFLLPLTMDLLECRFEHWHAKKEQHHFNGLV